MFDHRPLGGSRRGLTRTDGAAGALALLLAVGVAIPSDATSSEPTWQQRLIATGPWPPAGAPPAARHVDALPPRPESIELGYRLFRETRFSVNGYVGCVSCHQTDRAFTDNIARAQGVGPLPLNTPSLLNLAWFSRLGWHGQSGGLTESSLRPLLDRNELASDPRRVAHVVRVGDGLACRWQRVFGVSPAQQSEAVVLRRATQLIGLFTAQLTSGRTPFDEWRDGLAGGRTGAPYPAAAQRGAQLFAGRAGCMACHAGPLFSDGRLHQVEADRPAVRTAPLRHVAMTAPYWHDGSADTLADAVRRHRGQGGLAGLSDADMVDLVAFMGTLTDRDGAARRWPALAKSPCPATNSGG